jgi:hypothetical protein
MKVFARAGLLNKELLNAPSHRLRLVAKWNQRPGSDTEEDDLGHSAKMNWTRYSFRYSAQALFAKCS